jgi:hypothetical protein
MERRFVREASAPAIGRSDCDAFVGERPIKGVKVLPSTPVETAHMCRYGRLWLLTVLGTCERLSLCLAYT